MINFKMLENMRDKREVAEYFKANNINITSEEIDILKQSYEQLGQSNGKLTLKQLDDVAGGVLVAVRIKMGNSETAKTAQRIYSTKDQEHLKIIKGYLGLSGKTYDEEFKWMFEPESYNEGHTQATSGEKILEATQIPVIYLNSNRGGQEITSEHLKPENLTVEEVYTCSFNNLSRTYEHLGDRSPFSPTSIGKICTNDEFEEQQKNNAVAPDRQAKANKQVHYKNQGSEQQVSQTPVHDAIDNFINEFVIVSENPSDQADHEQVTAVPAVSSSINRSASHAQPHNKTSCLGIPLLVLGVTLFAGSIGYTVYSDLQS